MADGRLLALGASGDAGAVFAALAQNYTVHAEPSHTMTWTWLDTADWRLHHAGVALREERSGRRRELVVDRNDGSARSPAPTPLTGVRWPARLDAALDAGPARDALDGLVGVRALLPVAEVETRRIPLRLMDAAGKTRVRVSVDQQRLVAPRRAALPLHVAVVPLRGYDDDAQRCVDLLADALGATPTALSPTSSALAAAGQLPGAPGGDDVPISPTDTAVRPVALALLNEVAVLDRSRDGAIADLDTEFLHDLRSALRETAALLAAAGHLLPGRSAQRVLSELTWLDHMTTPLRVVDIALLELDGDGALDTSGVAGSPAALRDLLLHRRARELRRMRRALRSPRAPGAFTAWQSDLRDMLDADLIGPSAAESARTLTRATYRAVLSAAPLELRDRVLAMRNVLDAFAAVHPADAAGARTRLRADLDALDADIRQRDGLRAAIDAIDAALREGDVAVPAAVTAGALLDRAERRARRYDKRIARRHARFGAAKSAGRVAEIAGASR